MSRRGLFIVVALEEDVIERGLVREGDLLPTQDKNFIQMVFFIPSALLP